MSKNSPAIIANDSLNDVFNRVNNDVNMQNSSMYTKSFKSYFEMSAVLQEHWIFQKAVTIEPFKMVQKFRNLVSSPDGYTDVFKELNIKDDFFNGVRLARIFGGCIAVMHIDDGMDTKEPLDLSKIRQYGFKKLELYEKPLLEILNFDDETNISGTNYTHYKIKTKKELIIHKSRVLEFKGDPTLSSYGSYQDDFLGNSVIYKLYDTLVAESSMSDIFANLPIRLNQMYLKIPGLSKVQNDDQITAISNRVELLNKSLTMFKTMLIDAAEEAGTLDLDSASITALDKAISEKASSILEIPEILFLGKNPTGLGANGESALTIFYDKIEALQGIEFDKNLLKLDKVIAKSHFNSVDKVTYEWIALYTKSLKIYAETDAIHITNGEKLGLLIDDEFALRYMYEKGALSEELLNIGLEKIGVSNDK